MAVGAKFSYEGKFSCEGATEPQNNTAQCRISVCLPCCPEGLNIPSPAPRPSVNVSLTQKGYFSAALGHEGRGTASSRRQKRQGADKKLRATTQKVGRCLGQ